jgi:hypothetical protein
MKDTKSTQSELDSGVEFLRSRSAGQLRHLP